MRRLTGIIGWSGLILEGCECTDELKLLMDLYFSPTAFKHGRTDNYHHVGHTK